MDRTIVAVILAGGIGSRLYPASRGHRPKQFLPLPDLEGDSVLARTVTRADFADATVVVTRPAFADAVREHAPDATVLVEPAGRDTGPAVTYATHHLAEAYDDPVAVTMPADHHVEEERFRSTAVRGARVAAATGSLVTFGVEPTRPDTGYGYVEPGARRGEYRDLVRFHEKPDAETAARYLAEGYLWNAGLFAWTPDAFLRAARESPLAPLVDALDRGDPAAGFEAVDAVSVDRAVMEDAAADGRAVVVPVSFAWDDLGSWDALRRVLPTDDDGTAALGETLTVDVENSVVVGADAHVSAVGVSDVAVVAWGDRVLVVPVEEAQRVREVVDRLRDEGAF
jgi:mannose-1-phosphate guanylyltransferase